MRSSTSKYTSHTDSRPWTAQAPSSSRSNAQVRPNLVSNAAENQKRKPHPTFWDRSSYVASPFNPFSEVEEDTASDFDDFVSAQENFDEPDEAGQDFEHYSEDLPKYKSSYDSFSIPSSSRKICYRVRYYSQVWGCTVVMSSSEGQCFYGEEIGHPPGCRLPRSLERCERRIADLERSLERLRFGLDGFENYFYRLLEYLYRHSRYESAWSRNAGLDDILDDTRSSPKRLEIRIALGLPEKPFIPKEWLFFQDSSPPSFKVPMKQKPGLIRRFDKALPNYSKMSYFRESVHGLTILDSNTQYTFAEGASDGIEEGYNVVGSDEDFDKLGAARWRAGPGRKKSWKASPKGKVPSRRQRRRGKRTIRNVEHFSGPSKGQQQDQRLGHEKHSSDIYLQTDRYRSAKHRAHYICVDDFAQYATSPHVAVEPRVSIQTAESEDTGANLVSLGQLITATRHGSNEMYDATSWAFRRSPREEAHYQSCMAALRPQLLSGPLKKASGRGKKHKQRGISKFNIPRFNDLGDLGLSLKGLWISLQDKSTLLHKLAPGQESASPESYLKLYKTIEARRRQLTRLENVYATMNAKYKHMENEERAMKAELNRIHRWLMSVTEQYHVMALQPAPYKDRFIDVLPQPIVKRPPQHPLLHKHGIIEEGPDSITRLLDSLSDDEKLVDVVEQIHGEINNWSIHQLSILQYNLQSCLVVGDHSDRS